MTPHEYVQRLDELAARNDFAGFLEFDAKHGPAMQELLTREQWMRVTDLGHWAAMAESLLAQGAAGITVKR
jgi:hypothetical protein